MIDRDSNTFLHASDQQALDALIDSGLELDRVPEPLRDRARRAADILHLAAGPAPSPSSNLVDRVLTAVNAARISPSFSTAPKLALTLNDASPELVPDDEEAIDAFVTAGYRTDKVPSSLRARAEVFDRLGQLIAATPPSAVNPALLVERTLAAIHAARPARQPLPLQPSGRAGGFRIADLISVAAAVVLGASVIWPVLTTLRSHAARNACASNMASLGSAFSAYAGDHRNALPIASASLGGPTWWDVGSSPDRSNSANLFRLPKNHYIPIAEMACPGNANAERDGSSAERDDWTCLKSVSYSYHVMFGPQRPHWGHRSADQPMIILADKSPVVARAVNGESVDPFENSPNHGGEGQWALRSDASASWLTSPQRGEDNIWLPGEIDAAITIARRAFADGHKRGVIVLRGNEVPASAEEMFVGP